MPSFAHRRSVIALLLAVVITSPCLSENPGKPTQLEPKATDVVLGPGGMLMGQVVDSQGRPMAEALVRLYDAQGKSVDAMTSVQGHFAYRDVSGGVYYLQSGDQLRLARTWAPGLAPPSAQQGVLLVCETPAVRGQSEPPAQVNSFVRNSKKVLANPLAVAGIAATAVAVPVIVHNADSGS